MLTTGTSIAAQTSTIFDVLVRLFNFAKEPPRNLPPSSRLTDLTRWRHVLQSRNGNLCQKALPTFSSHLQLAPSSDEPAPSIASSAWKKPIPQTVQTSLYFAPRSPRSERRTRIFLQSLDPIVEVSTMPPKIRLLYFHFAQLFSI